MHLGSTDWFMPIVSTKVSKVVPGGIDPASLRRVLLTEFRQFGTDSRRDVANYEVPPSKVQISYAKRSYTTKSGKKLRKGRRVVKGYVRTLTLKKSWSVRGPFTIPGGMEIAIVSSGQVAPYNKLVRGKPEEQSALMKKRGWRSYEEILVPRWNRLRARLIKRLTGKQ